MLLADDGFVSGDAGCRLQSFAEEEKEGCQVDERNCVFAHLGKPRDPENEDGVGVANREKSD